MPIVDDRFRNVLSIEVTQSAADTLTFQEVPTGVSLGQGLGIVIDEISYYPNHANIRELDADTDTLMMALTTSDQPDDIADYSDSRIVDTVALLSHVVGTAGNFQVHELPIRTEFTPPIILATPRLFLAVDTAGFGAAATARVRVAFRYVKLTPQEYLEVAETFLNL